MSLSNWPSMMRYRDFEKPLLYQRAIYGKVTGQRSDYRWIARSPGFQGHQWNIQRTLSIGVDDSPRQAFLWYVDREHERCYAVFCYRSSARDFSGRSGFLEKQILECRLPEPSQMVPAALTLLREAASKDSSEWTPSEDDKRWADSSFYLSFAESKKTVTRQEIEEAVDIGLAELGQVDPAALQDFYCALIRPRESSGPAAFLELAGAIGPEALAGLLLPLKEDQLAGMSLAGGLPVSTVDEARLRSWSGVVHQQGQVRDLPSKPGSAADVPLAKMMVDAIHKKMYPRTAPLLEFAVSEERWCGRMPNAGPPGPNEFETIVVRRALKIIEEQSESDGPLSNHAKLANARRRHLKSKLMIIMANAIEAFGDTFQGQEDDPLVGEILSKIKKRWQAAKGA